MLSIYLAARHGRRLEVRELAAALRVDGFGIASEWHDAATVVDDADLSLGESRLLMRACLRRVEAADVLLFFAEHADLGIAARGGRCIEMGYAFGKGVPVISIGPNQTAFCALAQTRVTSFPQATDVLREWRRSGIPTAY